ncbi:Lysophospholipase L1 [Granulicella rosea]|uniref:Lysophospholipase L1 n=1 Tax=Granulicella rosea TaxID=474952 RepID=A0A239J5J6_9BACT|nr:rhamnogalacturonan acetylesterase [Granulicella rosea]SNT01085.1 Lysophospholipase L1 [Granulicella rosea]
MSRLQLRIPFRVLALLLLAFPLLRVQSRAQNPANGTPDAPPQTEVAVDAPLNPKLPTVFIVGDSTARNKADLGWGDHFAPLFDTTRVNIANRAMAGRSSRTYINEGRWAKVLAEMKPGDYLLLQMGHNDSGDLGGAKPRGSIHSIGEETKDVPQTTGPLAGQVETVHTYGWYLRKYIAEARAKGATPILLTTTVRNIWKDGKIERDIGYNDFIRQVGAQEKVPVADMGALAADKWQSLGPAATAAYFPIDHTHTSPQGATINAICVAAALQKIHSPVAQYLKQ